MLNFAETNNKKHRVMSLLKIALIVLCFGISPMQPNSVAKQDEPEGKIVLMGNLSIPDRSASNPIQVTLCDNALQISFNADLGSVNIVVSGAGGTLYDNTVSAYEGGNVQISLTGVAAGSYTLMVSSSYGNLFGGFDI